jgi:monovalent cation:H+ antiporter-2, CPA2 family
MPFVLAAGEVPDFIAPLAAIVVAAAAVAWLCQRLGLVPIVGFLLAGVLIGPNALGVVEGAETVEIAAELGVVLLLFSIGIEFSLERLARVRRLVLGGGVLTVGLATAATAAVVLAFGGAARPALYTGLLVSVSPTAVVLSLLSARHEMTSTGGQLSVAVLVFEDIAVVAMVLLVPMLGTEGGSGLEVLQALGTAAVVIAGVLLVARRLMPPLLESVARLCSPEVFLLVVVATCTSTAYLTALAGVGVSLGAFLAGLVVSESRFSAHALGEVVPLQIVFTATFFLSVGMLLDPAFVLEEPLLVAAAVVAVLVIKATTGTVAARVVGIALPVAAASALVRAQIGEFSFVLEQVGRDAGLSPGDRASRGSRRSWRPRSC